MNRFHRTDTTTEIYYTPYHVTRQCADYILKILRAPRTCFVDTSMGDGRLLSCLQNKLPCYGVDVSPTNTRRLHVLNVYNNDWLQTTQNMFGDYLQYAVGFNPPFGYKGALARKFIMHSISVLHPQHLFFLLPRCLHKVTFKGYSLLYSAKLDETIFDGTTGPVKINTSIYFCHFEKNSDKIPVILPKIRCARIVLIKTNRSNKVRFIPPCADNLPSSKFIFFLGVGYSAGKKGFFGTNKKYFEYNYVTQTQIRVIKHFPIVTHVYTEVYFTNDTPTTFLQRCTLAMYNTRVNGEIEKPSFTNDELHEICSKQG